MSEASTELVDTLFNEIANSHWTFDGEPIEWVNRDEVAGEIVITLQDTRKLKITVEEVELLDVRTCPSCGKRQSGWPDEWANIGGKNLLYACSTCVEEHVKKLNVPTVVLERPHR